MSERRLNVLAKQELLCGEKIESLQFCETYVLRKSSKLSLKEGSKRPKEHLTMSTLTYGDQQRFYLTQDQGISYPLHMIIQGNFGFIF